MTTFQTVDTQPAAPDAGIKRDQWGRYLIPHPETGKQQAWTRATTLAGTLADRFGLEQWDQRNVVLGIGARRDLYAQAAAATPDDKKTLNGIAAQAKEAAKGKAGANMGSALHRLTERVDAGELDPTTIADPELRADVEAYVAAMSAAEIAVVPGWLERVLLVPEIDAAGTCDRLTTAERWALERIGDVKTGKDVVRWAMAEIPLQLAIYAHASHWYDPATGELHEMPPVDQGTALVMHLPAGQATCTLYDVDIKAGWEAVQLAVDVRRWRKRKGLAQQIPTFTPGNAAAAPMPSVERGPRPSQTAAGEVTGSSTACSPQEGAPDTAPAPSPRQDAAGSVNADRWNWLADRVEAIKAAGDGPKQRLAGLWSLRPEIPTLPKGGPRTEAEVDAIAGMCELVEMEFELSFGPSDPTAPEATKATTKTKRG